MGFRLPHRLPAPLGITASGGEPQPVTVSADYTPIPVSTYSAGITQGQQVAADYTQVPIETYGAGVEISPVQIGASFDQVPVTSYGADVEIGSTGIGATYTEVPVYSYGAEVIPAFTPVVAIGAVPDAIVGREIRIPFSITDDGPINIPNIIVRLRPNYLLNLWDVLTTGDYTFTRASSATYVDEGGVIQTALTDVLRDSHYVQGERSVLVEGQRTNLVKWSEDLSNALWANFSWMSMVEGGYEAPYGGDGAQKIIGISGKVLGRRQNIAGATNGVQYTFSCWCKKSDTNAATHVRLTTNNISAWNTGGSTKVTLTNDWQHASVTWTQVGTGISLMIGSLNSDGTYDADCEGDVVVWGAQVEESSPVSSYIKTESSVVTRAADALTLTGTWDEQPVTQYERYYDQATGAVTDEIHRFTGTTAQALALFRAYTHVIVAPGTRSIEYMRLLAGVTA